MSIASVRFDPGDFSADHADQRIPRGDGRRPLANLRRIDAVDPHLEPRPALTLYLTGTVARQPAARYTLPLSLSEAEEKVVLHLRSLSAHQRNLVVDLIGQLSLERAIARGAIEETPEANPSHQLSDSLPAPPSE